MGVLNLIREEGRHIADIGYGFTVRPVADAEELATVDLAHEGVDIPPILLPEDHTGAHDRQVCACFLLPGAEHLLCGEL